MGTHDISIFQGTLIFRYFKYSSTSNFKLPLRANPFLQPRSASLDVFRAIDVDRGGSLSLQEFSRILAINTDSDVNVRIVKSAILKQAFNMMDKNRSQSLTKEELSKGLGPFVSMDDVNKMWA